MDGNQPRGQMGKTEVIGANKPFEKSNSRVISQLISISTKKFRVIH